MKILIFNWRDIKNPVAGGSEIYFHELAKKWVKKGHEVMIICGGWKGCKKSESIEGIKIIRVGNSNTLYLLAPFAYFKLKEKPDVIIDVENGIPFFTPLFTKEEKFLHMHHSHKDVWFKEKNFLLASIGWIIETKIMPLIYKDIPIITLSNSSKEEIKTQLHLKNFRGIINPGIYFINYKRYIKSKKPTILFLNRIKKYKGIEILLKAANELKNETYDFWIAGDGDYLKRMNNFALKNKLFNVKFLGKISETKKYELMQKSWIFVNPSFKEGWGIVNIEASYFGLPVIGSNVGGIKDSVVNGKTGLLFEYGNFEELAQKIKMLVNNPKLRKVMEKNSKIWAKKFDWSKKAKEYLNLIENYNV